MFILRIITKIPHYGVEERPSKKDKGPDAPHDRLETNHSLGESYNLVHKFYSPYEFDKVAKKACSLEFRDTIDDDIFAFVVCYNGSSIHPLRKRTECYIMTESGQTFNRIVE